MWFNGRKFRRAKHLTWRYSNPQTDIDLWGGPVPHSAHIAIVKKSDCVTYRKDDREYLSGEHAPAIPLDHGGTDYGYGKSRRYQDYWTRPMYLVRDGQVWVSTLRYSKQPNDYDGE